MKNAKLLNLLFLATLAVLTAQSGHAAINDLAALAGQMAPADIAAPAASLAMQIIMVNEFDGEKAVLPPRQWPAMRRLPFCDGEQMPIKDGHPALHYWPVSRLAYSPVIFGEIRIAQGQAPELDVFERSSGTHHLRISCAVNNSTPARNAALDIWATRFHPGVLLNCDADLVLFAGEQCVGQKKRTSAAASDPRVRHGASTTARPRYVAIGVGTEYTIHSSDDMPGNDPVKQMIIDMELEDLELDRGWMLVWWGTGTFFKSSVVPNIAIVDSGRTFEQNSGAEFLERNTYEADSPFLMLFDRSPKSMAMTDQGFELKFAAGPGKALLMPLLGGIFPHAADTEAWAKQGLPEDVLAKCVFWAEHSKSFPVGADETHAYDGKTDTVTVNETFRYEPLRDFGRNWAPVPPFAMLAMERGLPIRFDTAPVDTGCLTVLGPMAVVPDAAAYVFHVAGLSNYLPGFSAPAKPEAIPVALRSELVNEVDKIMDAGHLAPWMRVRKNVWGWAGCFADSTVHLIHEKPGETLYFLSRAFPYLPDDLRAKAVAYLKAEREQFPPEFIARLSSEQGARREAWGETYSNEFLNDSPESPSFNNANAYRDQNFYVRNKMIPCEALYHLAYYHLAIGEGDPEEFRECMAEILPPYLANGDWATGGWRPWRKMWTYHPGYGWGREDAWCGLGGVMDAHRFFNAAAGVAAMGRMLDDKKLETFGLGLLTKAAILCAGLYEIKDYLYRTGFLVPEAMVNGSDAPLRWDVRADGRVPYMVNDLGAHLAQTTGFCYHNQSLFLCWDIGPELGRFMSAYAKEMVRSYYQGYIEQAPSWYTAWDFNNVEGENDIAYPQHSWQIFLAQAYVLDAEPGQLAGWLDVPWLTRGNLYYLDKLVTVMDSHAK